MPLFWRIVALGALVATASTWSPAQLSRDCELAVARPAAPCIDKVDPPNWWASMPSPMLLLYGRNLMDARISVDGPGVTVTRTQSSSNGHHAFVWLKTAALKPQTIQVRVTDAQGSVVFPFQLQRRRSAGAGFQGFSAADSVYLIMTDRFADGDKANHPELAQRTLPRGWHGGDFKGIEDHLEYLQQLGITTIWITPAYDNSGAAQAYHGYSATDMYRTDPHFGTLEEYQHLVQAVHARGMKFVLDTVPNHVGAANRWAQDPPAPDWFHGTVAHHDPAKSDFSSLVDPHADWQEQKETRQGWFANVLPDLNQENPLVAQYLIQNAIWWIETGALDGLRIDTFPYVSRAFWQEFHAQIHALYPRLTTVGEVFNQDPTITSFFAGGVAHDGVDTGLWTPFDFPTYFALREVLSHRLPMSHLEDTWRDDWLYPHPERLVPFIGNHDTSRFLSMPGMSVADLKVAFGILLTMRGMPQIYSGDEIAMRGGDDPDNRQDFPGGFYADKQDAFTASGRTPEQAEVHDWVAELLRFRNAHSVFAQGGQQDLLHDETALVYLRAQELKAGCGGAEVDRVLVAINDADQPRTLELDSKDTALAGCTQFQPSGRTATPVTLNHAKVTLTLGAKEVAMYTVR